MTDSMVWWASYGLGVDSITVEVHRAFAAAGIPHRLLKGPAIVNWLYGPDELRPYGDSDFLVDAADWERAGTVLSDLGFAPQWEAVAHRGLGDQASFPFSREGRAVDLHATLSGLECDPADVWDALSADPLVQRVLDADIPALGEPARALHVALHAAHHHQYEEKPRRDLEKALEVVDDAVWREALALAERLDGVAAFGFGLRLVPGGPELMERIGVPEEDTVQTRLRERPTPLAEALNEVLETPGIARKLRLLLRELAPTPAFMRWWSPLARRGTAGLAAAYLWRPIWLLSRLPRAIAAVLRARGR